MLTLVLIVMLMAFILGALLALAGIKLKVKSNPLVEQIDDILPQSQCGQCGYAGCKPYAEAIARGEAPINLCTPGGQNTVLKIAELLGVEPILDKDQDPNPTSQVAFIHEDQCIGCTKCIQACPVDAIIGTNKVMHTVVADLCTGCKLCVDPCPTNCIEMIDCPLTIENWDWKEVVINTNDPKTKEQ